MLGILLIYFIGKYFYNLAGEFNKKKWPYAILGVASYYAGTIVAGFILGILIALGYLDSFSRLPETVLGLITIPFGILACWGSICYPQKAMVKSFVP